MILCFCLAILTALNPGEEPESIQERVEQDPICRKARDMAIMAGLKQEDANELAYELGASPVFPPPRERVEYWEDKEGFDLFPFLQSVLEVEGIPFKGPRMGQPSFGPTMLSQSNILNWIVVCHDPESSEWLIEYVETQMKEPIRSINVAKKIYHLMKCLGYDGSDKAVDILFRLQSKEAWENAPPVEIQIEGLSPEATRLEMDEIRRVAVTGIAFSGTDRALHAFATGEGLADDMLGACESYFITAAHARLGIYSIISPYEPGLQPELKAALEAIYDEYGVKYPWEGSFEADSNERPPLSIG